MDGLTVEVKRTAWMAGYCSMVHTNFGVAMRLGPPQLFGEGAKVAVLSPCCGDDILDSAYSFDPSCGKCMAIQAVSHEGAFSSDIAGGLAQALISLAARELEPLLATLAVDRLLGLLENDWTDEVERLRAKPPRFLFAEAS